MRSFEDLACLPDEEIDVAQGAALIAKDAYPSLDADALVAEVSSLGAELEEEGLAVLPSSRQATRLAEHMYGALGFSGGDVDYHDPRSNLLSDVVERKKGLPIMLALIYEAIARRAGVETNGVCFPGHYLVRIERNERIGEDPGALLVDPFSGGRLLAESDLVGLLHRVHPKEALKPEHVAPASARIILYRMLFNLSGAYLSRADYARAYIVADRMVAITQESLAALKLRAMMAARLGVVDAVRADVARALERDPKAFSEETLKNVFARLEKRPKIMN
jgi:regulator of sirC expression with transglutaminase-like and TPR domain